MFALRVHVHKGNPFKGRLARALVSLTLQVHVVFSGDIGFTVLALVDNDADKDDQFNDAGDEAGHSRTGVGLHLKLHELGLRQHNDSHEDLYDSTAT